MSIETMYCWDKKLILVYPVGCPIEYLTIQAFELEQKWTSLHLSKIRHLPKIA
jgi:hypothetical protein